MSQKNLLISLCALSVVACGHYSPPETFESKMARYQVRNTGNSGVPEIEPIQFKTTRMRAPASVEPKTEKEDINFSNRKLYFITLYKQYHELSSFSQTPVREIKQCPSFHSALVDHSEVEKPRVDWKVQYNTNKIQDENYVKYYPELYLSMDDNAPTPRVVDLIRNDTSKTQSLVQSAIEKHVDKTHAELAELCEYGTSDNYYAFENLNTEIRKKDVAPASTTGMKILLKTTLFSNKALIESLKQSSTPSRSPASAIKKVDFEALVMNRLGVPWAKGYYQSLKERP
ncbi:MAG: hypothetical protein COW01_06805 [Bdellovibrionales bacterium CG12_big_fil_rev_8_21_14_0_65_38_15]|nr:MAG: hypothetical protein COW79_13485 [Bdellovibrionales bacterium CG22_combo_CG10-13_8_21_14_all_38_13]PIQ55678.1 MAG: hypothetical protein COW01_06805 [Bdellovibrionales bacterium CG12_big_fil_rev_8_21_14_0_65_38_15]PIR30688.1 MAG: hypothetical protein COV38_04115 [Bdellovibrionales bacterium CG11_big_fil_rev_8_21_14_0_20_38_13]